MIIYAKLLVKEENLGGYITYVFQNMDKESYDLDKYVMCTRFPNWEVQSFKEGDIGFLHYKDIIAGRDTWYSPRDGVFYAYNYNGIQFLNFIKHDRDKRKEEDITM